MLRICTDVKNIGKACEKIGNLKECSLERSSNEQMFAEKTSISDCLRKRVKRKRGR